MIDRADDHYELNIDRAKKRLGWQPEHSLLETLPIIIENLKANPEAWYEANDLDLPAHLIKKTTRNP
jgi:UDP-glucose 4-epimerase